MDKAKYTTITVPKVLKKRLDAIAAQNRRSAPQQIEFWCDQATLADQTDPQAEACPETDPQPVSL